MVVTKVDLLDLQIFHAQQDFLISLSTKINDRRLRVVSNFGDGDCGAGEIHTRVTTHGMPSDFYVCSGVLLASHAVVFRGVVLPSSGRRVIRLP